MDDTQKEEAYFCRFTFGQFFALLLLEILTLFFIFYLGSRYGIDFFGQKLAVEAESKPKVSDADPVKLATAGQDPAIKELAKELVEKAAAPELKQRVSEILARDAAPPAPAVSEGSSEKVIPAEAGISGKPVDPRFRGDDKRNSYAPEDPAPTGGAFALQVGSYPSIEEASDKIAFWKDKGFSAYLLIADIPDKGRWYRVRIGTYATKEEAENHLARVKLEGSTDALVVSSQ